MKKYELKQCVILLCGPPGTGKTILSSILYEMLHKFSFSKKEKNIYFLTPDKFAKAIWKNYPVSIKNEIDYENAKEIHKITTELIMRCFKVLVGSPNFTIIVEDEMPDPRLREYIAHSCRRRNIPYYVANLYASVEVLITRRPEIDAKYLMRLIEKWKLGNIPENRIITYNTTYLKPEVIANNLMQKILGDVL